MSGFVSDEDLCVWIDVADPTAEEMERIAGELGLHHLAVEDALDPHQRDKFVHYGDHVFLVVHAVELDVPRAELLLAELDVFIGERWIVTVHAGSNAVVERIARRIGREDGMPAAGVGRVLYGLLDVLGDGYVEALDRFEQYYDGVTDKVFADEPIEPSGQRAWFEMRRALNRFSRLVGPLAEALDSLVERDIDRFDASTVPYLRDVRSEVHAAASRAFGLRELVGQIVDVNLTLRDYRQNVVMKKVTSWAAIVAVPTLVTGAYGMNVPYPGSGEEWGVVAASTIAVAASAGLYVMFRRRGWL